MIPITLLAVVFVFTWACSTLVEAYIWDLNQRYIGNLQTELNDKQNHYTFIKTVKDELAWVERHEDYIHNGLFAIKSFFFVLIFTLAFLTLKWPQALVLSIALFGFYFYCHQFFLYKRRNVLNPKIYLKGGFSDGSNSSQSNMDKKRHFIKDYTFRQVVLICATILFVLQFLIG